jgi:hypothetical protein
MYKSKKTVKSKTAKPKTVKAKTKSNPWMAHLKKVRASNKGMSLKEAMKKAKATYKKK